MIIGMHQIRKMHIEGWEHFSLTHPYLIQTCEFIVYGCAKIPQYNDNWDASDKKNALAHLKSLESFEFIVSMIILQRTLMYLKEAVVKIQGKNIDLVAGVAVVIDSLREIKLLHSNVFEFSHRIYEHALRIADITAITPSVIEQQQHRANPEFSSAEDYFKKTLTISFLDYLISDLSSRFNEHTKCAASFEKILPSNISNSSTL